MFLVVFIVCSTFRCERNIVSFIWLFTAANVTVPLMQLARVFVSITGVNIISIVLIWNGFQYQLIY